MTVPGEWHLTLLGPPHLTGPDGRPVRCERKTLALLAYLALEGPTPRARLATLLWPDTPGSAARNNLVHLLRRLRTYANADLILAGDTVELSPDVRVDARQNPERTGHDELLAGVDLDELTDLQEWLMVQREQLAAHRRLQLQRTAQDFEDQGDLFRATQVTLQLLDTDPCSEDAHRRLMRLHYLAGDRPAALGAWQRCRDVLARELGVQPTAQTEQLAREIERGSLPQPQAPRPAIPLRVLRPPTLVGREDAWAQMQDAWDRGQFIILSGEPGVGKSRLAMDFASSKGKVLYLEGRPGDAVVPYSTSTRNIRAILRQRPDMPFEPWAVRALSRLLPELDDGGGDAEGNLRLHQALQHFFMHGLSDVAANVFDDLQYADDASIEAGFVLISTAFPLGRPGGVPHLICCSRRGELGAYTRGIFDRLIDAGQAVQIDLEPLRASDVEALLTELDLPAVTNLGEELTRFTGGNPLFVLETVKHLLDTQGEVPQGTFPVAQRAGQVITQRFARLSRTAQQAARAASVLQRDFTIELVADVLRLPLIDAVSAWEELEQAQFVSGERFSHDLVYEAIRAGIPASVRRLLHRAAAGTLERNGGRAARIAQHRAEGGEPALAATWLLRAAQEAQATGRPREASAFYQQAERAYTDAGDADGARRAREAQGANETAAEA